MTSPRTSPRTTVAAIDCGTNSIKLLIGEQTGAGFEVRHRESRVVRLGQGVDVTGELAAEALARTFGAVEELAARIREYDVPAELVRFCATSATRDARNADVFTAGVEERLGVRPEVLSGMEEAALVYDGAVAALPTSPPQPVLVVDIGGGSTELVLGESGPRESTSMDIGSVRLTERHLHDDPPTDRQVEACVDDVDRHLDGSRVDIDAARSVIGTSGTIKTIACGVMDLPGYDREAFDGVSLRVDRTLEFCDGLLAMTVEQRRALPYMHPGRADVIGAGALIWSGILRRSTCETYLVSEADILHGIARGIGARGIAP